MHLSRMQILSFFALLSFWQPSLAQKPGGFSDFDDNIILEDKKKTNKDLDFIDEGTEPGVPKKVKKAEAQKTKKQTDDLEGIDKDQAEINQMEQEEQEIAKPDRESKPETTSPLVEEAPTEEPGPEEVVTPTQAKEVPETESTTIQGVEVE